MAGAYLCSLLYLHGVGMLYRLDTAYKELTVGSVPQTLVCLLTVAVVVRCWYIVQSCIGCLYFVTLACLCSDFCVIIL